jgi:hypothetical protein
MCVFSLLQQLYAVNQPKFLSSRCLTVSTPLSLDIITTIPRLSALSSELIPTRLSSAQPQRSAILPNYAHLFRQLACVHVQYR